MISLSYSCGCVAVRSRLRRGTPDARSETSVLLRFEGAERRDQPRWLIQRRQSREPSEAGVDSVFVARMRSDGKNFEPVQKRL